MPVVDKTLGQKRKSSHQNLLNTNQDTSNGVMKREITSKRGLSKPNLLEVDKGDSFGKP